MLMHVGLQLCAGDIVKGLVAVNAEGRVLSVAAAFCDMAIVLPANGLEK